MSELPLWIFTVRLNRFKECIESWMVHLLQLLNFLKNKTSRHIFQEFDLVIKSQTLFTCCYGKVLVSICSKSFFKEQISHQVIRKLTAGKVELIDYNLLVMWLQQFSYWFVLKYFSSMCSILYNSLLQEYPCTVHLLSSTVSLSMFSELENVI